MHPWRIDKRQRLAAKVKRIAVLNDGESFCGDFQQIREHPLRLHRTQHDRFGILLQYQRDATGVILFGVVGDEIVDPVDPRQLSHQDVRFGRVRSVYQRGLLGSADEIGVVAGPVG